MRTAFRVIWPVFTVLALTIPGSLLSLGLVDWLDRFNSSTFDAGREIGVGMLTGGLIGGALLFIEERREFHRDAHDHELDVRNRRHALVVALTVEKDLTDIVLTGQDLRGAVFSGRDLSGVNLETADLSESHLFKTNLSRSSLLLADLTDAFMQSCDGSGANFTRANLQGADLRQADLSGANLHGANLNGAKLFEANLAGASLYAADLSRAALYANGPGGRVWEANLADVSYDERTLWPTGFVAPPSREPNHW